MKLKKRILVASPVHQKREILSLFLESLKHLNKEEMIVDFYFIDDNENVDSSCLLIQFQEYIQSVIVEKSDYQDVYSRDGQTHYWNEHLVWKVADFKNSIIQYAKKKNYDYLFLVDSDLLLFPETLSHLVQQEKDIISEVFWTKWQPDSMEQPQVWLYDEYTQYDKQPGENLSTEQINARYQEFITKMRNPGVYEVGGLGACTLISQNALKKGVNFNKIPNLTFWGEDRHFCIRAAAMGLSLYVDTHYPAHHIYRDIDIKKGQEFVTKIKARQKPVQSNIYVSTPNKTKLTLSMVIKNEENRYLEEVLRSHLPYIDDAVIIDDGSTDNSVEVCKEVLKTVPYKIIRNEDSKFSNEVELRKQQWEETVNTEPNWILNMDADEIFEDKFDRDIQHLLTQGDYDLYSFRLYDFWNDTHYRQDDYWRSHFYYRPFLVRYRDDFSYTWKETPQHCGRFPNNIFQLPNSISNLRVKHYGWSKLEYRLEKYKRYLTLDPHGQYGMKGQYDSILDENPNLIKWEEQG
ncbi:glycosyltransferase family 2 protein [Priestia megaterium]|uniref:glycosyltransferase n=1 Tax=Priestia megaterium TaxID=1404 RepID=UPI001B3A3302|nr:glycosyltransferase [Priestia megaterium]MBQ4870385.1 glycosyltransferase family 2 protein [Priestia megaterium]